jgi:glutamate synthase domain-containing protein 2
MNRIGGKSNSGEGGEDSDPLHQLKRCGWRRTFRNYAPPKRLKKRWYGQFCH